MKARLGIRWTVGDVSEQGFEALRLSIWGAHRLFGADARYRVCVNTVSIAAARARTGPVPEDVEWQQVDGLLHALFRRHLDDGMAQGVGWKFAPLRAFPERHEIALDNDCILWERPAAMQRWLEERDPEVCLIAEDVRACFGQFSARCGEAPRNSGIRGTTAQFDLEAALAKTLAEQGVTLRSELDEQGLQVAALSRTGAPHVVSVQDVAITSPFAPHLPHLGRCGAHFVGLNARSLGWSCEGRPAEEYLREHWRRWRGEIEARVGADRRRGHRRDRVPP